MLKAGIVLSNAHPKLTFLKLLQPKHLTSRFKEAVERSMPRARWRASISWSTSCHYVGFESAAEGWQHRGLVVLGCSIENYHKAHAAQLEGIFPDELAVELVIHRFPIRPGPKGQHTITLGVQHTPVRSGGGDWDSRKQEWGDLVCESLFRYAPT
jgi:phytoene dehydrogenase-like protein